jgi:Sulfotransferase family
VGDHRSGTTLLYQMLASTGHFHVLNAYQVIHYDEIVTHFMEGRTQTARQELEKRFAEVGVSNRVFDGVRVTPDLPEEYGFVIEDSPRPQLTPSNRGRLVELCQKLRLIGGSDKPVLLKNPWDVLSFVFLKESFPEAKLIFLQRHPLAVVNSQLRAIRSLMESHHDYHRLIAPWYPRLWDSRIRRHFMRQVFSSRLPLWRYIVPRHVARAANYFMANFNRIPAADAICFRYEDICSNPSDNIQAILRFLEIEPEAGVDYAGLIDKRPTNLLPEVVRYRTQILRPMQPYLDRFHYGLDVDN